MSEAVIPLVNDPIIMRFSFTIESPVPVSSTGMARLAAPLLHPAEGWPLKGA